MAFPILGFGRKTVDPEGKVPRITQRQLGEDGLICVAIMLAYHGVEYRLKGLRRRYPQFARGASFRVLMDLLTANGLQPRALECPVEEIDLLSLPCILHWNMRQFVVLAEIRDEIFYISDPASRCYRYTREAFECNFSESALEVYNPR